MACIAPDPSGTACRRTSLRGVHDQHIGVIEMQVERLPGPLQKQRVTCAKSWCVRRELAAVALDRDNEEIAAFRDHAGEHRLPDQTQSAAES